MIDPASFKLRFPEFACFADEQIQVFLGDAIVMLNEAFWDTKYDLGLSYLTAHYLALAKKSEAGSITAVPSAGPVSAKAVDGVSVTYAVVGSEDDWDNYYKSTSYGQRYLALRSSLGVAAVVV